MPTDRNAGLVANAAFKAPCRVATIANITLSGLQTVDGVSLAALDRVLVKTQTNSVENGIYTVDTGAWSRAKDFNGAYDVLKGTLVLVNEGAANQRSMFRVTSADTIVIGTDAITFEKSAPFDGILSEFKTATAGQTVFTLANAYTLGINALEVYVNGLHVNSPADYVETNATTVTFTSGLQLNDEVLFLVRKADNLTGTIDAANVSYTPAGTGAVATNVKARLDDFIYVKGFGAVGDGIANDTAAQLSALTRASAAGGGVLVYGPGSYLVNSKTRRGGLRYFDSSFPTNLNEQSRAAIRADTLQANGEAATGIQALSINGTPSASFLSGFLATAVPDIVCVSGWGMRGTGGTNPLIPGNIGAWFENNTALTWALEVDCNNEGATQAEGSFLGGVGILLNTGSTFSPGDALHITRVTGAGSGPGWLRGVVIEGARNVGLRISALNTGGLTPAAPGTIQAIQVLVGGDSSIRWLVDHNGALTWGPGNALGDIQARRVTTAELAVTSDVNSFTNKAVLSVRSNISANSSVVGEWNTWGKDSGAAAQQYSSLLTQIISNTAGSESSQFQVWCPVSGTITKLFTVGAGAQIGSPTGGDKGTGTLNFAGTLWSDGTQGVAAFGPAAVTSITVKNGIITAIS